MIEGVVPKNRACDLCFSKKIKCDRDDPCANCLAASTECLRQRPRRRVKNTAHDSHISSTSRRHLTPRPTSTSSTRAARDTASVTTGLQQSTTARSAESENQNTPDSRHFRGSFSSSVIEKDPATTQAQDHIESELQTRAGLDGGRREILKTALAFATQATCHSAPVDPEDVGTIDDNLPEETFYPSAETLYFILNSPRKSVGLSFILDIGSLISVQSLEKQAFDLIEGRVSGATRLHYMVNVNFVAWMYLGACISKKLGATMQRNLLKKRQQYESNLNIYLHRIGVLDTPSLPLLQALLSGAMFMLLSGKLEKCWQLSTTASRVCMALGGAGMIDPQTMGANELQETRYTISICYMFDKALALSMNRSTFLQDLEINPAELVPSDPKRPYTSLIHVFLQLAEVQDSITYSQRKRTSSKDLIDTVQSLQNKMWKIKDTIREFQTQSIHMDERYFRAEWMGVDFAYYSVMTSIFKLHPYLVEDCGLHQQLLGYARTSLSSLQEMLTDAKSLVDFHTFSTSVSWLVLFYPLYPFFVLFTHAVNASSIQDFELLSGITTSLRDFAGQNSALLGVQRLFEVFNSLCRPIFEKENGVKDARPSTRLEEGDPRTSLKSSQTQQQHQVNMSRDPGPLWTNPFHTIAEDGIIPLINGTRASDSAPIGESITVGEHGLLEEDGLLAELYSMQPSIEWIDGVWHP